MTIFLVRHGETAYNRDGLGLGRADAELTGHGLAQAAALGARFAGEPLHRILTSPLVRCRRVAEAIRGERAVPIEPTDALIELDVGETEGITFAAMRERFPEFLRAWASEAGVAVRMPGGESIADVDARLSPLVDELRAAAPDEHVAIVSHNFVTKLIICRMLGLDAGAFRSVSADLASVTVVESGGGRFTLRSMNDRCHLDGSTGVISLEP